MFRGFYLPDRGSYEEKFVDAESVDQLPAGSILIVKINKDGTREVVDNVSKRRSLTPKESQFHKYAQRHLEFKHDGGDTPEMRESRKAMH